MTDQELKVQKALCTCMFVDMVRTALSSLGSGNTADKTKSLTICYEEAIKTMKENQEKRNG